MWKLIERFGPLGIAGLILVGGLVWFITDFRAEPGTRISILGIIEYTKPELTPEPAPQKQETKPEPEIEVKQPDKALKGNITSPSSGSQVENWFEVVGTISGQHRHLWLIVRVGQLYWPKEPELTPQNGQWVGEVNEGGNPPGGRFEVLLVDVSENVSNKFQKWLEKGLQTNNFPGFQRQELRDARILDSKQYQLITK